MPYCVCDNGGRLEWRKSRGLTMRYSLITVFAGVALVAICCAALVKPSYMWASGIWTLTIGILAAALIGCFYGNRRARASCLGVALFGWGHMILAFAPWFDTHTGSLLFTRAIVEWTARLLGREANTSGVGIGIWD